MRERQRERERAWSRELRARGEVQSVRKGKTEQGGEELDELEGLARKAVYMRGSQTVCVCLGKTYQTDSI